MKKIIAFLTSVLILGSVTAQDADMVFTSNSMTWFGFDYSEAYFIGTEGFTNPDDIKSRYFDSWNNLILNEPGKFDIGKFFYKDEVENDLSVVSKRNAGVDINNRVINDLSEAVPLDENKVRKMINEFEFGGSPEGLGLVFIVESYNKISATGTYYVTFFDISTRKVLLIKRMEGKAKGFGVRNYWVGSYYAVMKSANKMYEKWENE